MDGRVETWGCTYECSSTSRFGEHLCDVYKCENGNLYHACSLKLLIRLS